MFQSIEGLILIASILILATLFHVFNLNRIYRNVSNKRKKITSREKGFDEEDKKKFFASLSQPQGSNFNAGLSSAWILFVVALIFYFFLTPTSFSHLNYFWILPSWASNQFGFLFLGIVSAIAGWVFLVGLKVTRIYSYYNISKIEKEMVIVTWFLLAISLILSVEFGSIYPHPPSWDQQIGAFLAIFISEGVLLSPFILEFLGVKR